VELYSQLDEYEVEHCDKRKSVLISNNYDEMYVSYEENDATNFLQLRREHRLARKNV